MMAAEVEENIEMDLREVYCEVVNWIKVAQEGKGSTFGIQRSRAVLNY
jgi:hypothetical protein